MQYFGDFAEDSTVYIPFNTFSSDDPSASVTITNLVDADIKVHKDGSVTQIVTDGATVAIDFDSITGNHLITIDTSAHADYSIGSDYQVRIEGTTVDGGTINAWVGNFSIENRFNDVNVVTVSGTAQTANDNGADINTLITRIVGTLAAGTHNPASAAQIAVLSDLIDGGRLDLLIDAIKAVTDAQAATGTGLTAIPWNASWDAEVQSEVNDGLVAFFTSSAQLVDDIYDEATSGHNVGGSFGKAIRQIKEGTVSVESTVNDASATTTSFITALTEATDNHYKDVSLIFIDGALIGQSKSIFSYNGTTKTIVLDEALTEAPANGDAFIIKTDHIHTVTDIQAGLATEAKQDATDIVIAELTTQGDTNETKIDTLTTNVADVPTVAEFEARTPTAAQLAYITANSATGKPVTFSGTGTTTSGTLALVDGATPSATDDQYKGRLLVFNAGTLDECVTDITAYNGTTKVATVTAVPVAITSSHTARLI